VFTICHDVKQFGPACVRIIFSSFYPFTLTEWQFFNSGQMITNLEEKS